VLTALSNDFIPCSMALLAQQGVFHEIGKNNIWSVQRTDAAASHIDYLTVAVDDGCRNCPGWNGDPWWMQGRLQALTRQADAGTVHALPVACFAFENEAIWSALRLLQHGHNIGKVVIHVSSKQRTAPRTLPSAVAASTRRPRLVRVCIDKAAGVAMIELNDPSRFNTLSAELGEDMQHATQLMRRCKHVHVTVLQGAGAHFCAGGNPYAATGRMQLTALAFSLHDSIRGFAQLRGLPVPVVCSVQGKVVGGGNAASRNTDYIVSDMAATFEHGNLVRGVCPLGGYSQTQVQAIGRGRALTMYLSNSVLSASDALAAGVVHEVCLAGVKATQQRAVELARLLAANQLWASALVRGRKAVGHDHLRAEATGHAACLLQGQASLSRRSSVASSLAATPLPIMHSATLGLPGTMQLRTDEEGRVVQFNTVCGHSGGVQRMCSALATLTPNAAPSLRVVVLSVWGGASLQSEAVVAEDAARLEAAAMDLARRGVVVVCEVCVASRVAPSY
jgi:enoyl-CoA hydratase/carnithine racemase